MEIHEDLFLIEDLFRVGNSISPRLDHLREKDIVCLHRDGKTIVFPDTGGVSTFNRIHPRLRGTWWKCSAGTVYPLELEIVCDKDRAGLRHYLIQPAFPMTIEKYLSILREFSKKFHIVE